MTFVIIRRAPEDKFTAFNAVSVLWHAWRDGRGERTPSGSATADVVAAAVAGIGPLDEPYVDEWSWLLARLRDGVAIENLMPSDPDCLAPLRQTCNGRVIRAGSTVARRHDCRRPVGHVRGRDQRRR